MSKNLEDFDDFDAVDTTEKYTEQLNDWSSESAEAPIKTLYLMTQSTLDTVDKYAEQDSRGFADVVRAAVHLLSNATPEQRKLAYEATKVIKKKRGRKPKIQSKIEFSK